MELEIYDFFKTGKSYFKTLKKLIFETIDISFREYYTSNSIEYLKKYYADEHLKRNLIFGHTLIAKKEGEVTGCGILYNNEIRSLYVKKGYQRLGLGEKIITELEKIAKEKNILYLTSEVTLNALDFYKKCGYKNLRKVKFSLARDVEFNFYEMRKKLPVNPAYYSEKAVNYFQEGFNCAQSVFASFAESFGLNKDFALKNTCGFGAGMHQGKTCGAVTGAYMILGLFTGRKDAENKEAKYRVQNLVNQFNRLFQKKHAGLSCEELLGMNISCDKNMEKAREQNLFKAKCPEFIKTSAEIVFDLINP